MEDMVQLLLCVATCQADIINDPIKDFRVSKNWKGISKQYVIMMSVPQKCFLQFLHFFPFSLKLEHYGFLLWELGKE